MFVGTIRIFRRSNCDSGRSIGICGAQDQIAIKPDGRFHTNTHILRQGRYCIRVNEHRRALCINFVHQLLHGAYASDVNRRAIDFEFFVVINIGTRNMQITNHLHHAYLPCVIHRSNAQCITVPVLGRGGIDQNRFTSRNSTNNQIALLHTGVHTDIGGLVDSSNQGVHIFVTTDHHLVIDFQRLAVINL